MEGRFRHAAHVAHWHCFSSVFSFSFCVRPCGRIEQLARSRSITLHGLSDQAVTLHCLPVDKHTLVPTRAHTHRRVQRGFTVLQFCLVSGAESRGMFPWHGPAGRGLEAFSYTHGCVSSPLSVRTASVFYHHAHTRCPRSPAVTAHCRHKQAMTMQSYVRL